MKGSQARKRKVTDIFVLKGALQILCFLLITLPGRESCVFSQEPADGSYRLLFYNTGNLFDTRDDSLKEDNDFLPDGVMRWNNTRYKQKINSVYKVITASGGWEPPSLVGLCEIENRKVLGDLVYGTWLSKFDYGIVHYESNDPRGIDLAILYRKSILNLLESAAMIPDGYDSSSFKTRYVLYTKWLISGDTIHLFFNHWPSRRGGVLPGEPMRKSIAEMVLRKSDSISKSCQGMAKIIVAGDFNCTPDDSEMQILTGDNAKNEYVIRFKNLSETIGGKIRGTYKYRGAWEMLDQVIVSESLLNSPEGIFTAENFAGIFSSDFLLRKDNSFTGVTPFATYTGYRYTGGFSDHLPVFLDLRLRQSVK
jgi:endonuclease/exonuclease/phosphatase family metal-dependent hydrolase